jgi:1-acyl-sn-glycerol-3-phosphate acyltransferase
MTVAPPSTGYPPPPGPLAARAFARYVRWQARRSFAAVRWQGHARLGGRGGGASADQAPVLFVANHTNWWDGFLSCLVSGGLGLGFRVLMEERNLARYRAFLRIGALPIRRTTPQERWADLEAARAHLVPGVSLWVYPQGERRPAAEPVGAAAGGRPLERGAAQLALAAAAGRGGPVRLCPVAFRYVFLSESAPEAFILLGEPWTVEGAGPVASVRRRALGDEIERRLAAAVAELDARLAAEAVADFAPLVPGRLSINKRMDRVRHAMGLLDGPFEARNG